MRNLFSGKQFISIVLIAFLCGLASEVLRVILPLSIFEIRRSSSDISLFRAIWYLPNALLALFIGVINDRMPKTASLRISIFVQLLAVFSIALLYAGGMPSIFGVLVLSFVFATANYAYSNAQSGFVQKIVLKDDIMRANSILRTSTACIAVSAPIITAYFIAQNHREFALDLCIALLMFGFIITFELRLEEKPSSVEFKKAFVDGINCFLANRPLLIMTSAIVIINGTQGIYSALLIPYVMELPNGSSFNVGLVFSLAGLGSIVGAVFTQAVRTSIGIWISFTLSIALTGALYLAIAFTTNLAVIGVIGFVEGLISAVMGISVWSFRQETTPQQYISTVVGITGSVFKLAAPVMIIAGGYYAEAQSIQSAFFSVGVINIIVSATILRFAISYTRENPI